MEYDNLTSFTYLTSVHQFSVFHTSNVSFTIVELVKLGFLDRAVVLLLSLGTGSAGNRYHYF